MGDVLILTVLVGLAAFRASRLIASDTLLAAPRHWVYLRFPPIEPDYYRKAYRLSDGTWQVGSGAPNRIRRASWLGKWIECPWCSSVWFAAAITAGLATWWSVPLPVLVWAAACSVAGICANLAA